MVRSLHNLFVDDLDLLIDYLSCKPVDRHVYPVMLFALHVEFSQVGFAWSIFPALSDHIDQQVPSPRLIRFSESSRDRLTLRFWLAPTQSC